MVVNNTQRALLADDVDMALSFLRRLRGLMFRKCFPRGRALLIGPCRSVHTFHMRFPIDVVFLDKDSRVVGMEEAMKPWRVSRNYPDAYFALEVPAGTIQETGTQIGDLLEFVVRDRRKSVRRVS